MYLAEDTWSDDRISTGAYTFVADGKGNPNVIFKDSSGLTIDSAADGGSLFFSFIHAEMGEFGIVAVYETAGVVETFNVVTTPAGKRKLLWTSNRSGKSMRLTKVASYTADCE
jgi:hypothetical protein